jgi:hypothetical protein
MISDGEVLWPSTYSKPENALTAFIAFTLHAHILFHTKTIKKKRKVIPVTGCGGL